MNFKQIAELCNCTVGTVSKAFSGKSDVSEEKRNEIFKIAKENGCFEKYYKDNFNKKVFAVICHEINSAHYAKVVTYITEELEKKGFLALTACDNFSQQRIHEFLSFFTINKKVDGVFIIDSSVSTKLDNQFPIIYINYFGKQKSVDFVNNDKISGFLDAIAHLKKNGHTKIAYIGEKFTESSKRRFIEAMTKHQLHVNNDFIKVSSKRFSDAGYDAMEQLYRNDQLPTAIYAAYDELAIGAIACMKEHGHSVPNDFSIIGKNDISFASNSIISLTTINENNKKLCDMAIDLMIKKLDRKFFKLRQNILVKPELVIRNSVKDLNKN